MKRATVGKRRADEVGRGERKGREGEVRGLSEGREESVRETDEVNMSGTTRQHLYINPPV